MSTSKGFFLAMFAKGFLFTVQIRLPRRSYT